MTLVNEHVNKIHSTELSTTIIFITIIFLVRSFPASSSNQNLPGPSKSPHLLTLLGYTWDLKRAKTEAAIRRNQWQSTAIYKPLHRDREQLEAAYIRSLKT
jgi:hypothetical protein